MQASKETSEAPAHEPEVLADAPALEPEQPAAAPAHEPEDAAVDAAHQPEDTADAPAHEREDAPPAEFWDRPLEIYEVEALRDDAAPPAHEPAPSGTGSAAADRGASPAADARDRTPATEARDEARAGDAAHGEAMAMLQRLFPGEIVDVEPDENVPTDDAEPGESG